MTKRTDFWLKSATGIRKLLAGLLERNPKERQAIMQVVGELDDLEAVYRDLLLNPPSSGKSNQKAARYRPRRYHLTRKGETLCLAETRPGNAPPFLVAQDIYDFVAEVMTTITAPIAFEDLQHQIDKDANDQVPPYLVRTCMRFWRSVDPPLIRKVRTRYCPIKPSSFARQAKSAWRALPEEK